MVSDSDGGSAALLQAIREKLVEYKESLLRQLVEEREAALASDKQQEETAGGGSSVEKQETQRERLEESVEAETKPEADGLQANGAAEGVSESLTTSAEDMLMIEAERESSSAVEEIPMSGTSEEVSESLLKKRRLLETVEVAVDEDGQLKKLKTTPRSQKQQQDAASDSATVKADDEDSSATSPSKTGADSPGLPAVETTDAVGVDADTSVAESEAVEALVPLSHRVLRTSVPPRKYLTSRLAVTREEDTAQSHQQPILSANSGAKRVATTGNRLLPSVEQTNAEFDAKLRDSVRIHREVGKRSLSMTRKRQLPRLPMPTRGKAHWDFLLQEMQWLATDFAEERKWKRVMQLHLARDVIVAQKAESVRQEQENRQLARGVALQVSAFWRTMERIAARSRVRFEAGSSDSSADEDVLAAEKAAIEADGQEQQDKSEKAENSSTSGDDVVTLKYKKIDVAAVSTGNDTKDEAESSKASVVAGAKAHMKHIVSAGKRARSAIASSCAEPVNEEGKKAASLLREAAFAELQTRFTGLQTNGGPTVILAAFQVLALRWMLELYSSGLNMLVNDQLGMGKATTIVAFLSLIELVAAKKQQQAAERTEETADASGKALAGPHLVIVAEEELHKWRYYLRLWNPERKIQLYDATGNMSVRREELQREWKAKPRVHHESATEEERFLADLLDAEDSKLEEDERVQPVFCVLCPVGTFLEDREAFVGFSDWQMVIVENEHDECFEDPVCVSALQQLRQRQRRVLCNSQPIETWKSAALRLQYAEFLVCEAPGESESDTSGESDSVTPRLNGWPSQLLVEKTSAMEVMRLFGKSMSARASLWKASTQHENGETQQYINALLLALSCLSLRRARSEVEPQLGKIEELSLSCQLSASQTTQYRNALTGFAASVVTTGGREERLGVWLQLLLRLREICNCVDLVRDLDKLGHADLRLLESSSAKLETLEPLLRRLVMQEGKKVVLYCQFSAMFPVVELFLSLLDISFVRVMGSVSMQRRALCHFADRPAVRVALVSTRLASSNGRRAVSVFGGDAIIVLDSDWNATCDAKLRASWAKMAVAGGADALSVYRLHCENTIEASLLRVGASLSEKVFGEMTPQELLAVPSDMTLGASIEKPSWWAASAGSSAGSGDSETTKVLTTLSSVAQDVERQERFCGDSSDLEAPLLVHKVDLDAEEHLLLSNTDELMPVEWYAVNYVHGVADKKHPAKRGGDGAVSEAGEGSGASDVTDAESNTFYQSDDRSFEEVATVQTNHWWQDGDAAEMLFYHTEMDRRGENMDENALEKLFTQLRLQGMETDFDVYKPPSPPTTGSKPARVPSEVDSVSANQMTFRVSYRVPAPPPALPVGKAKAEHGHAVLHGEAAGKSSKSKKRAHSASVKGMGASATMAAGAASAAGAGVNAAGVKRKLETQLGGVKAAGGAMKEQRVDLEGIPVPDASELANDSSFWGTTDLDELDSWNDPTLLSDILGVGSGAPSSSSAASSTTTASAASTSATATTTQSASGAHSDAAHSKTQQRASGSKKSKNSGSSGRSRKSSVSAAEAAREAWSVHDDIVLKKLFELYGSNWTLIAQVFNSSTAVSRFCCKKRSPRQCYDRYGKIISGSLATAASSSTVGTTTTKEGKASGASLKKQRAEAAAAAVAAQLTPAVLDMRIGLPPNEMLLTFPARHSLPGLPPPSIANAPSLVEMTLKKKKKTANEAVVAKKGGASGAGAGGLDDLKSIRSSFDAIIQCMKHKTSPPPIPFPAGASSTAATSTLSTTTSSASTDLSTKASLTAASYSTPSATPSTTAKSSKAAKKPVTSTAGGPITSPVMPIVPPPPHKSHADMISLLPNAVLGPDEVIKRSKEAAVVAVQAAAAVASVRRDAPPLSATGDAMLGAGSGFGASVGSGGSMPRRSHAASLTGGIASVGSSSAMTSRYSSAMGLASSAHATLPPTVPGSKLTSAGAAAVSGSTTATSMAWGDMQGLQRNLAHGVSPNGLGLSGSAGNGASAGNAVAVAGNGDEGSQQRHGAMPVTTTTLLHVLDRMPEIKNKIQSILNRTDCSETQKVAMIARLLSNTNAINNNAVGLGPAGATTSSPRQPPSTTSSAVSGAPSSAVLSSLTADAAMLSPPAMLIDTETPIPMPASLAAASPPNTSTGSGASSTPTSSASGSYLPPTSQP